MVVPTVRNGFDGRSRVPFGVLPRYAWSSSPCQGSWRRSCLRG